MKQVVILGSTGSIGTQTLDVIASTHKRSECAIQKKHQVARRLPGEQNEAISFRVVGISAHSNAELFEKQKREFSPKHAILTSKCENPERELEALASLPEADIIVNALPGISGLAPSFAAVKAGKILALANKESLVMAGELLMQTAQKTGAKIFPIDSELSALWQILSLRANVIASAHCHCERSEAISPRSNPAHSHRIASLPSVARNDNDTLLARNDNGIEKVILTASGGPFYGFSREQLQHVTYAQALKHPTWKMGEKISIDSATLMNKAFEIIATHFLFGISPEKIEVAIHRQSIVHAMVQFSDGSVQAAMSQPDMRIPILQALFAGYADSCGAADFRVAADSSTAPANSLPRLDFSRLNLTFKKPDYSLFTGPKFAYEALAKKGKAPAELCLANELAIQKFRKGEISFLGIYDFIKNRIKRTENTQLSPGSLNRSIRECIP